MEKFIYVPPQVEVNFVDLESNIAIPSPIRGVPVVPWNTPDEEVKPDTGDIYLPI